MAKYIDASISSTINIPFETTVEDVFNIYIKAWEAGLKGVTIFRDGCKRSGILINEKKEENNKEDKKENSKKEYYKNNKKEKDNKDEKAKEIINKNFEEDEKFVCPECGSEGIAHTGGCSICLKCGYSGCN